MKLDLPTLAFILSLTGITQVVAFYIQHRVNDTYRGIGWWLLGSMAMAMGFITLCLAPVPGLGAISVLGVPLLLLSRICLFIGTLRFFERKLNTLILYLSFFGFSAIYYYFLFFNDNLSCRTVAASIGVALFSLLTARILLINRNKHFATASIFTAAIFLFSGFQLLSVMLYTLCSKPISSYLDYGLPQVILFVIPAITSQLWTFGFILMVNQRLASDNGEEKENLRHMFNTSPDAASIIRLDDGVLVDVNQGYVRMTGYPRDELIGASAESVCRWRIPADHRAFLANMKEQGTCENLEFAAQHRDGTEFIGMVSARIITIHELPHIISVIRDITERRKVERDKAELDGKYQQLQKAESLGRMAGAIAHHFNNQLQSVLMNLELLGQPPSGRDPALFLAKAQQATDRAADMSRLMLVYLGQTSREQELRDLSGLWGSGLAALQARLPDGVAMTAAFPLPGPIVRVNAEQMQQVLTHLTSNAMEALAPADGLIHLSVHTYPAAAIPTTNRLPINWEPQAQDYAWLEVMDNGSGIPEGDLEKLFDPFFSTRFPGRGLGLSLVLGIVQAHGGAVTLTSQPGQGSLFRIHLPLA